MRALWKGVVSFGIVTAPVKLYPAVRLERIAFHLLHDADLTRLHEEMVCPLEGQPVPAQDQVRGFELEPDRYVVVRDEDLAALEPEAGRTIEVETFVPAADLDPRYLERAYLLGPDADDRRFETLHQALKKTRLAGLCRFAMRKRAWFGALVLAGENLAICVLRFGDEVAAVSELGLPEPKLSERELKTARFLIETMSAPWSPQQYGNDYQARLRELLAAKARGEAVTAPKPRRARATGGDHLLTALTQSLAAARKKKDAEKKSRAAG